MDRKQIVVGIIDIGEDTHIRRIFRQRYMDCLQKEGVTIEIIPQFSSIQPMSVVERYMDYYVTRCDGVILPGGGDIDPSYWGEHIKVGTPTLQPIRDQMELVLAKKVIKKGKALLGICRGMQVMNVSDGGSLYQDIPLQLNIPQHIHSNTTTKDTGVHQIIIKKDGVLYGIFHKTQLKVNSMHHQAIKALGKHYVIEANSSDGVIEAIRRKNYPFALGVQWHPEHMADKCRKQQRIFTEFVNACGRCKIS